MIVVNKLWEEYIYRVLQNNKPPGFKVNFQNKIDFWENKTIRPDIVVITDKEETFVVDTKWKIIDAKKPSDDDLKQMSTYNLHWNAEKSMLLYPMVNQTDTKFEIYQYDGLKRKYKLGFVSVLQDGQLIKSVDLSNAIFKKFEISE